MEKIKKTLSKGVAYLKRNGVRGFCKRLIRKTALSRPIDYEKWLKNRQASVEELERQRQYIFERPIVFGIYIAPKAGEADALNRTIQSLKSQSYDKFAIIETADSGFEKTDAVLFVQAGTALEPDALFVFAKNMQDNPDVEWFYADHDYFSEDGSKTEQPECKPGFDLYYLRSRNYIGNAVAVRRKLAEQVGKPDNALGDAMIYDYLLRCAELTSAAGRIPRILFHQPRRQRDISIEEMASLRKHYRSLGVDVQVVPTEKMGTYNTTYLYDKQSVVSDKKEPQVSVIIPNKDNPAQLETCIRSILKSGGYENLEILIVENNSNGEDTFACYEKLQREDSRVRVISWQGEFQYSRINNEAVKEAKGSYILFLNNDTKIKSRGSLERLVNIGRQADVGAVGARLYYGDDTIQHAGVILGFGGIAGHAFEGMTKEAYEAHPSALALRQFSAVTAACMLVKREAFLEAGGFSEELGIAYNDIDLCMNIRKKGWKILYCPQAELYHYESQTRGLEMTREKAERVRREQFIFQQSWKQELEAGDEFYSPQLTLEKPDFSLKR